MAQKVVRNRFDRIYQPNKPPPTTRYYNQKYSGAFKEEFDYSEETQKERKDKRADSFERWKESENRVTQAQKKRGEHDQLGAVSSSWLTSLGYNETTNEAVATFKGSSAEFYYKMSYEMFLEWLNSPSKGLWLHEHPRIMHSYTMRGGRGSQSMQSRMEQFHTKNKLKNRGDKKAMRRKLKKLRDTYG
jgi:hypothetical protein